MRPSCVPSIIADVVEDGPCNALVEAAVDGGRRVVAYSCSSVPEPLLSAANLLPIRLRGSGVGGTPLADTYLSSVICTYPRSVLESILDGNMGFVDGWVFPASCDHLRRLCDNLRYLEDPAFVHVLDVPHKLGAPAVSWFAAELGALRDALASHFDVVIDDAAITAEIKSQNEYSALLREIGELRRRVEPPLTGGDFHRLLVAGQIAPRAALRPALVELRERLETAEGQPCRARLMLVGSHLDDPTYVDLIEAVGGLVVADRFCVGSLPGLEEIEVGDDPVQSLAESYLGRTLHCPRMMEGFVERVDYVLEKRDEYAVDGVVVESMKFCDLWGVESGALVKALRDRGVPTLRLEREYAISGEGQIRTRVQAFLESLGR